MVRSDSDAVLLRLLLACVSVQTTKQGMAKALDVDLKYSKVTHVVPPFRSPPIVRV